MDHAGHDHVVAVGVALIRVQKRPDLPGADFSAVIVQSAARRFYGIRLREPPENPSTAASARSRSGGSRSSTPRPTTPDPNPTPDPEPDPDPTPDPTPDPDPAPTEPTEPTAPENPAGGDTLD